MKIVEIVKGNKILVLLLVLSLAVNILFIGAMAGRLMMRPPPRPMPPGLDWLVKGMPLEKREIIRANLSSHKAQTRGLRREMFRAQRQFNKLITQEELDETEIRDALTHLRESSSNFQSAIHDKMISILLDLDVEDRQKALIYMREHRRDRPHSPVSKW